MHVAINVTPLKSAHKNRGIGYYTYNLVENLKKDQSIIISTFSDTAEVKEADIIHYPWFDFFFHTLPLRKIAPTVVTIHDVIPFIFKEHYPVGIKGRINFLLQKVALKNCGAFITDSDTSKQDIVKHLKLESKKVFSIPLAAEDRFKLLSDTKLLYAKRKLKLPDRYLLYVGDANWVKNIPFLIKAFKKLKNISSDMNDLKLVLVGGVFLKRVNNINHPELESLKLANKLIEGQGLEESIVRVGNLEQDELVACYNLATVYVQPSFYEGFGLPVLEAFACGVPVVCSNGGSLPEVGGDAALFFDPHNLDQCINLLREVLQNMSLREKLIKLGLKQAEKFSWQKVLDDTKAVYMKTLMR
ncbi:glycosyltransferase family 4 protein [Candidatus Daviesbacteria bacterium]|nr:glycosyltransferase family 4 protein [Candidatus Daviesbacteria bacterium]